MPAPPGLVAAGMISKAAATAHFAGTEAAIGKRGMHVASVRWGERKAFKYPLMRGLVAQEVEPDSKAAQEVRALFDAIPMSAGAHVRRPEGATV